MIVKITAHRSATGIAVVHAGPELATVMGGFAPARWQSKAKVYWVEVAHLDAFSRYVRHAGHTVVDDRAKGPEPEKFTGPLPECSSCGLAAPREAALRLKWCPGCGKPWAPTEHVAPVQAAAHATATCRGCGRVQRGRLAYCSSCGDPMPDPDPPGPRPESVPRPTLADPVLFGEVAAEVVEDRDHMQRAAGDL